MRTFDTIDSTSAFARKNLSELSDREVISADIQTDGHGQFERKWLSSNKNGGNCYISIVLKPENIEYLSELTKYTSLIVTKTLATYGLEAKLKYPNDVLVNDKKISGVLAESVFIGKTFKGVIVGIGVNLNLEAEEIKKIDIMATSIYNETQELNKNKVFNFLTNKLNGRRPCDAIGENVDKSEFIAHLLDNFFENYEEFLRNGIGEIK